MISINYRDGRPIYEQVRDGFRQLIITGVLPAGSRMPSVREMASSLTINPNTIQRAYRELEAEGYTVSVPGKGSFVTDRLDAVLARREALLTDFRSLVGELKQVGAEEADLMRGIQEEYNKCVTQL